MPRQRLGAKPMNPAERQGRHRAKLRGQRQTPPRPAAAARPKGGQCLARHPLRPERRATAVSTLVAVQNEYRSWFDNLPANLEGSQLAEKLEAICELDLEELQAIDLPRGYGRD